MTPSPVPNPRNKSKLVYRDRTGKFIPSHLPSPSSSHSHKFRRAIVLASIPLLLLIPIAFYIFKDLPSPTKLTNYAYPVSTQILDRHGNSLYSIFADQNRTPVSLAELPPHLIQATIAIEDKDFYKHQGLAITGIARAFIKNIQYLSCRLVLSSCSQSFQGGSTITQQLIKTALLTPERTIRRKLRELVLTIAVESIYSKDQILEMYLNQVPYGGTSYGIESAAQTYFGKKAKELTLAESSLLAGLPAAPTRFSPFGAHPELAKERQKLVLRRMLEDGYLNEADYTSALVTQLTYAPPQIGIRAPHFVLYVKDLLVQKFGEQTVEKGGLIVTTSLDIDLQDFAQQTAASEVAKLKKAKVTNAAALVTNPETGEILAMVGSKDYFDTPDGGNVNITLRPRQPGSTIKPLNYALGIETNRITPASLLLDIPTCFQVPNQPLYCPENYDNTFHSATHVRFALGNSYNIPAVKMLTLNGLEPFIRKSREFGITTFTNPDNYGLSLTLGGGEVRMVDLAVAFGVLANQGRRVDLNPILEIRDYTGRIIEKYTPPTPTPSTPNRSPTPASPQPNQVISPQTAYLVSHILLDNNARSATFGTQSYLNIPSHPEVSVKTGTTNDKRDNWTIGYNPERLTVVWVGNNDNTPLGAVASGITGASPIWNRIMKETLKNRPPLWPPIPPDVIGKTICSISGLLPPDPANPASCTNGQFRFEYFKKNNLPTQTENLRRDIPIDKTLGSPATPKTPPENVEYQNHIVVFDVLGSQYCIDCTAQPTDPLTIRPADYITPTPTPSPSP